MNQQIQNGGKTPKKYVFELQLDLYDSPQSLLDQFVEKYEITKQHYQQRMERFNTHLNTFSLKLHNQYDEYLKRMLNERGIWRNPTVNTLKLYIVKKQEDNSRRRMLLKIKNVEKRPEYIDLQTHQSTIFQNVLNRRNSNIPQMKSQEQIESLQQQQISEAINLFSWQKILNISPTPIARKKGKLLNFSEKGIEEQYKQNLQQENPEEYSNNNQAYYLKNKVVFFCEKITVKGAIWGKLEIEDKYIVFISIEGQRHNTGIYKFGALPSFFRDKKERITIKIKEITKIFTRSYNLISNCSIEIFTQQGRSYFFNLYTSQLQDSFFKKLKELNKDIYYVQNRKLAFEKANHTGKWLKGEYSNFDYLMILNTYAGRSYNDINQYPIMPWVIIDFVSQNIDLNNQGIYRDLSKPIGALNEQRLNYFIERFQTFQENDVTRFYYGSHYSGAGSIMHYLLRLEPFTKLNVELQSGHFDNPDRLFHSIAQAWDSCYKNTSDVKELIPEFYYLPDFLKNINQYTFGQKQNGEIVDDVILPKWAKTPEEFIYIHREALEHPIVSNSLHHWIDLIFGFKQQGDEAIKSYNLFYYLTYEGKVDLVNIQDELQQKATLEQIFYYGQTPCQLLNKAHPKRDVVFKYDIILKTEYQQASLQVEIDLQFPIKFMYKTDKYFKIVLNNKDFYEYPLIQLQQMAASAKKDKLLKTLKKDHFGRLTFNEFNNDEHIAYYHSKDIDLSFYIIGGFMDNTFKIVKNYKIINSIHYHKKIVTSVVVSEFHHMIIVGSKDTNISIWKLNKDQENMLQFTQPKHVLYSHHNEIVSLNIQQHMDLLFSLDMDGCVLIHSISTGEIIRSFDLNLEHNNTPRKLYSHINGTFLVLTNKNYLVIKNLNDTLTVSRYLFESLSVQISDIIFLNRSGLRLVIYFFIFCQTNIFQLISLKSENILIFDTKELHIVRDIKISNILQGQIPQRDTLLSVNRFLKADNHINNQDNTIYCGCANGLILKLNFTSIETV